MGVREREGGGERVREGGERVRERGIQTEGQRDIDSTRQIDE